MTRQSAPSLLAKTESQAEYIKRIRAGENVFGIGPAGTGKTYIPARIAAQRLSAGHISKIVIARTTVANKRHALGFRPGKTDQKLAEWMVPVVEALKEEVGAAQVDKWKLDGRLQFLAFECIRGITLTDAMVILDEGQNCSFGDLKTFLTRIGQDTQVVVTGDPEQVDIEDSGLEAILEIACRHGVPMPIVQFDDADVVRSDFVKHWVRAFRADDRQNP